MGVNYLIDTNVAIDYINDKLPESIAHVIDNATLNISVITRMELLVWKSATTGHLAIIQNFNSACNVYDLAELIILEGIHIRKTPELNRLMQLSQLQHQPPKQLISPSS